MLWSWQKYLLFKNLKNLFLNKKLKNIKIYFVYEKKIKNQELVINLYQK